MTHTPAMTTKPEALLTSAQVASHINKSVSTVNRYAKNGRLRAAVKLPGRTSNYLFAPADVLDFIRGEADAEAS